MDNRAVVTHRPQRLITSLVAFGLFLAVIFAAALYLFVEKNITLVIDGQAAVVNTTENTVKDFLDQEGIYLYPEDEISVALDSKLEHTQMISITRSFDIFVNVDGKELSLRSVPLTAGEVLEKLHITLGGLDQISLSPDRLISQTQTINVARINERYGTVKEAIAPGVERREDYTLEKGITKVLSSGKNGVRENTVKVTEKDGVEVAREIVKSVVAVEPKPKVLAYGVLSVASRGGVSFTFSKAMIVTATAYTHTGSCTASGLNPKVGMISVDPDVIPLGTKVYVENYGFAVAADVGSSIQGNRIDVFLDTEKDCNKWGRQTVKIYILD